MSDLFASLSARARGTAPVVRPRLPSLFESGIAEGGLEEALLETPAAPRRPAPEAAAGPPPGVTAPRWPEPAAPAAPRTFDPFSETFVEPPARPTPAPAATSPQPVPRPAPAPQPATPAAAERRPTFGPPADTPAPRSAGATAAPLTPAPLPPQRRTAEASAEAPVVRPTPPASAVSPRLPARADGAPLAPRPRDRAPPPPAAIEVSIGRIEVRFEAPSSPPRRSAEPSPVMSLADYLRARQGGGR